MPAKAQARSVIAAVLWTIAADAQGPAAPGYRQLVDAYLVAPRAAIDRMVAMDPAMLAREVNAAAAGSGWDTEALQAAMLMHTDAALDMRDRPDEAWRQIGLAQQLSAAVVSNSDGTWFVHQWSGVITSALRGNRRTAAFLRTWRAQRWYPMTAAIERGRLRERDAGRLPFVSVNSPFYDHPLFTEAVHAFEQGVAGHAAVAVLHVGRIRMLQGHDVEARELFESAARSHVRSVRYMADLFLGSFHERSGDYEAAGRQYRAAMLEHPRAQSGRVALAAMLARTQHEPDARAVLYPADAGGAPAPPSFDPWWSYLPADGDHFALVLAELHTEIRR